MQDPYRRAEDEYLKLRGQLAIGRITREQFETSLHALMVTDVQGRSWMLGTETGKWHVYDGSQWIPADPFAVDAVTATPPKPTGIPESATRPTTTVAKAADPRPVAAPTPPAKSGGGYGRVLLFGCLGIILACVLVGGGGYLALSTGALSTATLLSIAGMDPARITANNLRDEAVQIHAEQLGVDDDSSAAQTTLQLNPYDVKSNTLGNSGKYMVTFSLLPGGDQIGTCTLQVDSGQEYQFVTLPDKIVVNRPDNPPTLGTDLLVATSNLCRAQ